MTGLLAVSAAAVSAGAAVAAALGIRRHRPSAAIGWWLVAFSPAVVALTALTPDARWSMLVHPPLIAGLLLLTGGPAPDAVRPVRARDSLKNGLDAGIFGLGFAAVAWSLLAQPLAVAPTPAPDAPMATLARLVLDVCLLATLARLVLKTALRTVSTVLLCLAGVALLCGDTLLYGHALLGGDALAPGTAGGPYPPGGGSTAARLASCVFLAAAACHPSMIRRPRHGWRRDRLRFAVFVLLAPLTPILMIVGILAGQRLGRPYTLADALVPATLGGAQSLLIVVRLGRTAGLARRRGQALTRQTSDLEAARSAHERLRLRLAHHASHDALTGLPNRVLLNELVTTALADEEGETHLVLVDLDRFADVNDAHSHQVGDRLLNQVADRLRAVVRPEETVARIGVDQFALLLGGAPGRAVTALEALCEPYVIDGNTIRLSVSAGLVELIPEHAATSWEALQNANVALLAAKRDAGSRLVRFEPGLGFARRDHSKLALDLREALASDGFTLVYQPVVELDTGRIRSVEALMRWTNPEGAEVSPVQFIPVAEATGLIGPMGAWVLTEACRHARRWYQDHGVTVSVNVSAYQLRDGRFTAMVAEALAVSGLPGAGLVLEITESVLATGGPDETQLVRQRLEEVRELGIRVAIDDFGTGFSSLSYLRQLPAEILKVDRAFVQGQGPHSVNGDLPLLNAILHLADSVDMHTVAEGVETEEQARLLRSLGYPLAQGFLFHRPRPAAEIDDILAT